MAVSKVILNGNTLIDTTQKTVTASKMLSGETALNNAGEDITGNIATKTSSNMTVSGATVTAPAGYYASNASKSVASGSATPAATISATGASVSTGTNTLTLSKTVSNTPTVTSGYVSSGTAGNSSVSLTASVTTQAAQTIHPSTSDQTIASGRYLTGTQTVKAVKLTNLSASNIVSGVTVKVGDSTDDDCVASVTGTAATGGSSEEGTIRFIDYDGTVLHEYTETEASALTALPANPTHTGLTSQGWNWTLAQIKSQITNAPGVDITVGQMYITSDGKTRIYIHLGEERKSPVLGVCPNGSVDVDWGDGTSHDTLTGTDVTSARFTSAHAYANGGDYVITLTVTGTMGVTGSDIQNRYCNLLLASASGDVRNRYYNNTINKVEFGNNVTSIGYNAFNGCYSLTSLTIPSSVTSIGNRVFNNCNSLSSLTIPSGVTSIEADTFNGCNSLSSIAIPSSVTSIGTYVFYNCYSLTSITIPSSVTSIGDYAFNGCYSLTSIAIPSSVTSIGDRVFYSCYGLTSITIPSSVTSIGTYAFYSCYSLTSITIPSGVTSIGTYAFNGCYSLKSITIPSSVTSIGTYAFHSCRGLTSITIPSGVTSIGDYSFYNCYILKSIAIPSSVTSIGTYAFNGCHSLSSLTIPSDVTSIGANAFYSCYGAAEYHLLPTTPPVLGSSNAFYNIQSDCVIYVPYSSDHSILEAYKAASNWSTYASRMQEEPQ